MKYLFTLIVFLSYTTLALAQQPTQYSMQMFNKFAFNPAYAGLDNSLSITGVFRKQWLNLPGSPSFQNANAHMPLYIARGGIGINFENDVIGAEKSTLVSLAYNYQMELGRYAVLSFGAGAGFYQKELDGTQLRTPDGNYEDGTVIDHQDDILPVSLESARTPVFEAGVYLQTERFELGLAAKNLLEPQVEYTTIGITLVRNYFLNASYKLDLGSSLSVTPSVFVKTDAKETQMDFAAIFRWNDNISIGGAFRGYNEPSIDAIAFIVGLKVSEQVTVNYAYDMTLSNISTVSTGSHEIMLNYNLGKSIGKGKLPPIIYNPRFL